MKYYKHLESGEVFAYESESERQEWGSSDLVKMTDDEVGEHLNPQPTTEQLAEQGRAERDVSLRVLDTLVSNPLRYGDLVPKQKEEAKVYRQALLDVPQQRSFPETYTMPEIPTWLS